MLEIILSSFLFSIQRIKQRLQEASEITLNLDHNSDNALLQTYNKDFLKTITVTVYQNKEGQSEEEVEEEVRLAVNSSQLLHSKIASNHQALIFL